MAAGNVQENPMLGVLHAGSTGRTVSADFSFTLPPFYHRSTTQSLQHSIAPPMNIIPTSDSQPSFAAADYTTMNGSVSSGVLNVASTSHAATNAQTFSGLHANEGLGGSAAAGTEGQGPKPAVVDGLLQRIARYTQDARDAFSRSRDSEGRQRIAELKAAVDLLHTLVPNNKPITSPLSSTLAAMSETQRISPPAPLTSSNLAAAAHLNPPSEDLSRKRCASAQGDEDGRVQKSLKLEVKEETSSSMPMGLGMLPPSNVSFSGSISGPPTTSMPSAAPAVLSQAAPPPLLHSQTFPGSIHTLSAQQQPQFGSGSSSRASEPPKSKNATNAAIVHQLALMQQQQQQQQQQPPHPPGSSHSHSLSLSSGLPLLGSSSGSVIQNGSAPAPQAQSAGWSDPSVLASAQGIMSTVPPGPTSAVPHQTRFSLPGSTRPSRSSSYSGSYPFAFDLTMTPSQPPPSMAKTSGGREDGQVVDLSRPSTSVSGANSASPQEHNYGTDHEDSPGRATAHRSPEGYTPPPTNNANEIPLELKPDVDKHFFRFLNEICSDLDAKDSKGEPIHQPLMAKKMARLDESPDWRPFKFRIQAFTNAFLEELAKQGLSEEVIPMKKVRHYLWTNPYISRFNEEGKKAKSKGNHIWNVDAKKSPNGWQFRPFKRKITGSFQSVAYVGLKWTFQPKIWDPQASRGNENVRYSSPNLPPWLSWNGDMLSGTPTGDTPSAEFTIEAKFNHEGKDQVLTSKYVLTVAPLTRDEPNTYSMGARRPSLVNDRRGISDSLLTPSTTLVQTRAPVAPPPQVSLPLTEALQVVTQAMKEVSIEAHSITSPMGSSQIQSLLRQEEVLTVTANAITDMITAPVAPSERSDASTAIARAGADVVASAVTKVAADITASGIPEINPAVNGVPVQEVSSTTKSAVAQAVRQTNTTASPIEVLHTADEIIQNETQQPTLPVPMPVSVGPPLMNDLAVYQHGLIGDIEMQSQIPVMPASMVGPPYQMDMSDYPMQ